MTREDAIEFGKMWLELQEDCKDSNTYEFFKIAIEALQQEPRKGHWMINKEKNLAKCSNCKFFLNDKDEIKLLGTFIQGYNYCPYCGADMREDKK